MQIGWHIRNHFPQKDAYDVIRNKWFLPQTIKLLHSFVCNYIFFPWRVHVFKFLFVCIHWHKSSRASCLWSGCMSEVMYLIHCCPAGTVLRQPDHCYVSGKTFSTKLGFYSETFPEHIRILTINHLNIIEMTSNLWSAVWITLVFNTFLFDSIIKTKKQF